MKHKNAKKENIVSKSTILVLMVTQLLIVIFLGFYFNYKTTKSTQKAIDQMLWSSKQNGESVGIEEPKTVSPLVLSKLKESGVERYFLSKVDSVRDTYTPLVHLCLYKDGVPIYPQYIYETWSVVNYPKELPPQITFVRYLLLPEDNSNFQLDKDCYIKEIKTTNDWQEIKEKYGFVQEIGI